MIARIPAGFATLILCLFIAVSAHAATIVGAISRVQGSSEGSSEGTTRTLAVGLEVHLDEVITTGSNARLEVTFADGTVLTIGENARLKIDVFLYAPGASGNRLGFNIAGPFRFISGKLTKGRQSEAQIFTPAATLGVRGTDFWGGPIDGDYGVFLREGVVSVQSGGGESILDRPGQGVNITLAPARRGRPGTGGAIRGPVTIWGPGKVARAVATVTFE